MRHLSLLILLTVIFTSCKKDIEEQPVGGEFAIPIYNHAYQENYEADKIEDIIANAKNAYILIDPYENNAYQYIKQLKQNNNQVGGYISIGTAEDWRTDYDDLKPFCVSKQWGKWPGEYFVNSTTTGVLEVMKKRIDELAQWGCDWVEFDNMDWAFDDKNRKKYDFQVTEQEAIDYYIALCEYVHRKGMKCMAKNTVRDAPNFDGALYESSSNNKDWWNHTGAQNYLDANKLVIINHYKEKRPNSAYQEYINLYNNNISFICESKKMKKYVHFN